MATPSELSQVARALNYDKQGSVSQVSISATVGVTSVGIGTTLPRYTLEVGAVGAAGTSLWVNGDARITGILSVGTATITLDPTTNKVHVGTGITLDANTGNIELSGSVVATTAVVATSGITSSTRLQVGAGGTVFTTHDNGNVGIHSAIPQYPLDVNGSINSLTDVKIDGVSVLTTASDDATALAIALG